MSAGKSEMFHSAALKLTGWYLAIIMVLSIGCSLVIYHISTDELARNTSRQIYFLNTDLPPHDFKTFTSFRTGQLADSQQHLKNTLIAFNILVLVGGGAVSYFLARRTLEPIEESHEAQKRFAGDASHELRTPLAAMQTEIEVSLRDPKLSKQQAVELLQSNLEEVGKLKALSEGLLKLSATDNDKQSAQLSNLRDAVSEAIEHQQAAADAKKINLVSSLANISARGEHQNLVQLISILINNAIKYSPSKSEVKIAVTKKDKMAQIVVSDQGQGIKADDLPHIFERFYRTDSSRSKSAPGGYGLGLAIAKKIVDVENGSIEVKSAPNKGSVFTVKLPLD